MTVEVKGGEQADKEKALELPVKKHFEEHSSWSKGSYKDHWSTYHNTQRNEVSSHFQRI